MAGDLGNAVRWSGDHRSAPGSRRSRLCETVWARSSRAENGDSTDSGAPSLQKDALHDDASCLAYQRTRFLAADGETALLELSAYAAKSLAKNSPRYEYLQMRAKRIAELVTEHQPSFLICYGRSAKIEFESILGREFDSEGFGIMGRTIVALASHPADYYHGVNCETFVKLGQDIREKLE